MQADHPSNINNRTPLLITFGRRPYALVKSARATDHTGPSHRKAVVTECSVRTVPCSGRKPLVFADIAVSHSVRRSAPAASSRLNSLAHSERHGGRGIERKRG